MKEQFVTYEIALKLKELGFNEPCILVYSDKKQLHTIMYSESHLLLPFVLNSKLPDKIISAPLWQQVIDWFLKKKHLYIDITFKEVKGPKIEGINSVYFDIEIYSIFGGDAWKKYRFSEISDDYYYAREQAILKTIELCQE